MSDVKTIPRGVTKSRLLAEDRVIFANHTEEAFAQQLDPQRLIHELQVHQIELELQNDELRRVWDERQKMEALLGKYCDLYDFAPVGYFNLSSAGTIRAANLTGAGLMGAERSSLVGRQLELFLSSETRPVFQAFLGEIFAGKFRETCEVVIRKEAGPPLFVQVEAVVSESGEECRAVLIDITRRKLAESAVETLNSQLAARVSELEGANRELEAFNHTVVHDIRQPLNLIYAYCQTIELLSGKKHPLKELMKYVRGIGNVTLRMSGLIGALLKCSHSGQVALHRRIVDLSALSEAAATTLKSDNPERRVEFRIDGGITANGDADLLQVVVDNLLEHAWKAAGKRREAVIRFGATKANGKRVYFIRGNESGCDREGATGISAPALSPAKAGGVRDFGIGLATVERIILRHGGNIWIEEEPGAGTTIFFTLGPDRVTA